MDDPMALFQDVREESGSPYTPAFKAMSAEDYLRTEENSPFKREYVGGVVYPLHGQAGAKRPHALITGRIFARLDDDAERLGRRIYQGEMRLTFAGRTSYFYPDVMLVCSEDSGDELAETSPCLLVEVSSGSTAAMDRVGKFHAYTAVPSLQTYLIVEQTSGACTPTAGKRRAGGCRNSAGRAMFIFPA